MPRRLKYTQELLEREAKNSLSISDLIRRIGGNATYGSVHQHIKKMVNRYGISTDHFRRGGYWNSHQRKWSPEEIFNITGKVKSKYLHRALIEIGVTRECSECRLYEWRGKRLELQVDHINGDNSDNLRKT